jgi:hypothetical protein
MLGNYTVYTKNTSYQSSLITDSVNVSNQNEAVPLLSPDQLMNFQEGEMITLRFTHRKTLDGKNVRPMPIYSHGTYRMPMRWMYLNDSFDQTMTIEDIKTENPYQKLQLKDVTENWPNQYLKLVGTGKWWTAYNDAIDAGHNKREASEIANNTFKKVELTEEEKKAIPNNKSKEELKKVTIEASQHFNESNITPLFKEEWFNEDTFIDAIQEFNKSISSFTSTQNQMMLKSFVKTTDDSTPDNKKFYLSNEGREWLRKHQSSDSFNSAIADNAASTIVQILSAKNLI